jgi:hypothetical protein
MIDKYATGFNTQRYNMKMDPAEIEWSGMDWIDLTQDRVC